MLYRKAAKKGVKKAKKQLKAPEIKKFIQKQFKQESKVNSSAASLSNSETAFFANNNEQDPNSNNINNTTLTPP